MGRKEKKQKRRISSSSSESDGRLENSISTKTLVSRLNRLEYELKRKSLARSRSRSKHESRRRSRHPPSPKQRRSRSFSSVSREQHAVSRERRRSKSRSRTPKRTRLDIRCESGDQESATLSRVVQSRPSFRTNTESACSAFSVNDEDECSVRFGASPDKDGILLHDEDAMTLPDNILNILGDNPNKTENNTFSLHEQLAVRWEDILINGMKKGDCQNILGKYEIPTNLANLHPPKLNPEIKAALAI